MSSLTIEVFRLGLWSSITGGWFYDPHEALFTNTVHFYLWIFLVLLPFSLYLGTPRASCSWIWPLYCVTIAFIFIFIKLLNHRLHVMFDGEEVSSGNNEEVIDNETSDVVETVGESIPGTSGEAHENIELQVLSTSAGNEREKMNDNNHDNDNTEVEKTEILQDCPPNENENVVSSNAGNPDVSVASDDNMVEKEVRELMALASQDESIEEDINEADINIKMYHMNNMNTVTSEDIETIPSPLFPLNSQPIPEVAIVPNSQPLPSLGSIEIPFLSSESRSVAKGSAGSAHSQDTPDLISGAGCVELYPEVLTASNHLEESSTMTSSNSSGLKDLTRPGTPMPGRVSSKSSSHEQESRDLAEIFQRALESDGNQLSENELAVDGSFDISRTRCEEDRGSQRSRRSLVRRTPAIRRRRPQEITDMESFSLLTTESSDVSGRHHVAVSHDDTSAGAVHQYQDEDGNICQYVFQSSGNPLDTIDNDRRTVVKDEWESSSISSANPDIFSDLHTTLETYSDVSNPSSKIKTIRRSRSSRRKAPHRIFHFEFLPGKFVKIAFDRLALLALFDRNKYIYQTVLAVFLAVLVSVLGYCLLLKNFYSDFWIFLFCFVLAGCQFSLLKSVQPDASSPTHGFNHMVLFSRSVYFCILASGIMILDKLSKYKFECVAVYTIPLCSPGALAYVRDFMLGFILAFPLVFLLGLLPQINTFLMFFLEQLEIHVFGGNASTSVIAAAFAILRSLIAVALLFGFSYGALKENTDDIPGQHILFSVFSGIVVALSYHLSRSVTDPMPFWKLLRSSTCCAETGDHNNVETEDIMDPLPAKLQETYISRARNDLVVCIITAVFVFGIHVSKIFTELDPVSYIFYCLAGVIGFITHYVIPQLRKALPWLCCAHPILKSREYHLYEVKGAPKLVWFEKLYVWLCFIERNVVYPCLFLSTLSKYAGDMSVKFGSLGASLLLSIIALKMLRSSFSDSSKQSIFVVWTVLFFHYDYSKYSEGFPIDYFIMSIFLSKIYELMLKLRFVFSYIAPWQIPWGSAFHAFAQPFSIPHSTMLLFFQPILSSLLSAPLNPFLGSAIFLCSYVRPVKFWEKNYNTNRVDHTNTRLLSQLDRNPGADDNNLNSIFYEHLTRSLQHSLCGDILLGRWGPVSSGDCFVLASDYLNALVHVIEVGNGLITFQLRGLEFRGTYCQQREVEAITEDVESDKGCCCCEPGHLPGVLSVNAAFGQRWLSWQVTSLKYVIEGYSISDNSATSMLQVFDLRKILITYYVKAIIFYTVRSSKLVEWLTNDDIQNGLMEYSFLGFIEKESSFNQNIDEDYDALAKGISRNSFYNTYSDWIVFCVGRRNEEISCDKPSRLVTLCFALSLLGRRALGTAAHQQFSSLEFLYGLHALFKGDFRIATHKDEWVLCDMDLLRKVVAPGVRMSLKLHQDHFTSPDEYDEPSILYAAIASHEENLVIAHEGDPAWRQAVLANRNSLLALRHVTYDAIDDYKIIMLNKRHLSFRVIKVNRECVRGLWSSQLQELIFLRNRNPERGSIQNAKQVLRNIVNSSCDQPIGYPIYVSPLTTSYADTNVQLHSFSYGALEVTKLLDGLRKMWNNLRLRCRNLCNETSEPMEERVQGTVPSTREPAVVAPSRGDRMELGLSSPRTGARHLSTSTNRSLSGSAPPAGSKLSSSLSVNVTPTSAQPSPFDGEPPNSQQSSSDKTHGSRWR